MPSSCEITFNENPSGVFFSGQKISGKVELFTDEVKTIRGIHITIRGYADVRWSETRSRGITHRLYFNAHDEYFTSKKDVMGLANHNRFDLLPGKYEFTFENYLPYILPSSFIGKFGEIRYEVILTISRPWRFDNIFKQPFTVLCPLDLGMNPKYRQPVGKATKKQFSKMFCCGDGGEILVTGHIPYAGYAPGQHIPIDIIIRNYSSTDCYEAKIRLVKMVEYHSSTPHCKRKFNSDAIVEQKFGPFGRFQKKTLNCCLRVPPVPPTALQICKIIDLSYFVELELCISGLHSNMKMRLPVTIGTVPLFYGGILTSNVMKHPARSNIFHDGIYNIPAPPSYEEAVLNEIYYTIEADENTYTHSVPYVPKYPVYYEFDDIVLRSTCLAHHPLNEMKQRY